MARKIKADDIFTGTAFTGPGHVLVTGDDGTVETIVPAADAGEGVEIMEGILCPGFINAHCHIELSHMKDRIPQHIGLVDFVQAVMTQRAATDEEKQEAMQHAEEELYGSGTVAVGDICNTADSVSLKKNSKLYWHNFIEISGFVAAGAQKRFDAAKETLNYFEAQPSTFNLQPSTISPHAPYSVSKKLFSLINEATADQLISIHNQESAAENELYNNKSGNFLSLYKNFGIDISSFEPTGNSSFQSWLPYFTKAQKIISVHNTFTDRADLVFSGDHHPTAVGAQSRRRGSQPSTFNLQPSTLFFCLCPNANLFIENVLPPVPLLIENNCRIVLGTDSYASNTQLNIYDEIKTIQLHFPKIPLDSILQWATLNGAQALGIEDKYGSFEKGKMPGVVLINIETARRLI